MADFQHIVAVSGGTVEFLWSQNNLRKGARFCSQCSALWIKDRFQGLDFKVDVESLEGQSKILQLQAEQLSLVEDYVAKYLRQFGLTITDDKSWDDEFSIGVTWDFVSTGQGYYRISLTNDGVPGVPEAARTGHDFAVDMYDRRFFDANVGEASFDRDDQMRSFFNLWFRVNYISLHGSGSVEKYT